MKQLILIADDDATTVKILEASLVSQGYHVAAVSDGTQAVLKIQELKPDLVILDIQMPGAYGPSVYATLQGDPATAAIPAIFVSDVASEDILRKRIPAGPKTRFLSKPVDLKALLSLIKELLPGNGPEKT